METFQRFLSYLLAVAMIFLLGLGGNLHVLADTCVDGHCDTHTHHQADDDSNSYESITSLNSIPLHAEKSALGECNPFMCNVVLPSSTQSDTRLDKFETILLRVADSLAALKEPDNPDRPPNL